ncbi:MAG: hypothetical protein H0U03_03260 [Actinobacteria bacterium]|nr:hypothetical protein [Actinomycetota bacterium]
MSNTTPSERPARRPIGRGVMPVLALRPHAAARALGVSRSFFYAEILPELRVVRRGRLRLVPVTELEAWLQKNAARALVS